MAAKHNPTGNGDVPADMHEPALPYPVVGIGGSAGGLAAVAELFDALPAETGMAFVYVAHLAPDVPSHLALILARHTAMPVIQVEDEPAIEPNHVYVIPPNRSMSLSGGRLHLRPRNDFYAPHRPIDDFLRSLAIDQGRRAIGIVLSGLGDDGTLGLEEIKSAGGFAFAQDDSAMHEAMPSSAVAAGCVDLSLPPVEIAHELARMAAHPYVAMPVLEASQESREPILDILKTLRNALGVDFSAYKRSTLYRRIARRMVLHKLDDMSHYATLLRGNGAEVQALFQDILINVTCFFRDAEAFETIRTRILPQLTEARTRHDPIRIWVLGCSTGEEAYSLAILCQEFAQESGRTFPVQIFATDLNAAGIEKARAGIYPKVIAQDVSPARLRQYFVSVDGSYRVSKSIREMCVFARHNGLTEPPFSRMDLVSCRNMLIYLDRSLQQKLIPTLHYSLKPQGYMWLGSSEAVNGFEHLFSPEDSKLKIYRKKVGAARQPLAITLSAGDAVPGKASEKAARRVPPAATDVHKDADRVLLARYAPAGVLVNADFEILQFRGDTGAYLVPAPGKASLNLLKMVREGLMVAVRGALARAHRDRTSVRQEGLQLATESGTREVAVEVIPIAGERSCDTTFLVLFEEASGKPPAPTAPSPAHPDGDEDMRAEIDRLVQELASTRDYLQSVIEQQEAANEELQSANEEIHSSNEELQSINEELETSKEEIQSSNEELATVNDELHARNLDLTQANDDLLNLFASVRMPIVMLGPDLRIRRFTPMAEKLLSLRGSDVGRPIGEIKLRLSLDDIDELIREVIDTVAVREVDVKDRNGCWFSLRIWPYRTLDNKIDGAVLLLVDVDSLKRARAYAEAIVSGVSESLLVLDADLRVLKASDVFHRDFDVTPEQVAFVNFRDICDGRWNVPELRRALDTVRYLGDRLIDFEFRCSSSEGLPQTMLVNAQRLTQDDGATSIVLTVRDITERKSLEEALRSRVEHLAQANSRQNEFMALLAHELRNPLAALRNSVHVLERSDVAPPVGLDPYPLIERQIAHMSRMIDDLLDISRITTSRMLLQVEPLDLVAVLRRACQMMEPVLESRGQTLDCEIGAGPAYVDGDAVRLEQVLGNLLGNASKFSARGGKIWVTLERVIGDGKAGIAIVRVRDEGTGITESMLSRVFEPFVQAERSSASTAGLGIGLSLVRHLVEMHGGTIHASSEGLGHGACFEMHLPMRREQPPLWTSPSQVPLAKLSPARILIVDDTADAAESLAVLLRMSGHDVRTADGGPAALAVAADFAPEVVFLDIGLRGMDGFETARRLRALPGMGRTILIALTGYGQDEDRRHTTEAGFEQHLLKPAHLADVEAALSMVLRDRPPRPTET